MNLKVEWNKIVTNVLSTIVLAIVVGAGAIVWNGATSVDEKVQNNRKDLEHLIVTLSDKLAAYEIQLTSISNQLVFITRNNVENLPKSTGPNVGPAPKTDVELNPDIHQKARSTDIRQQFKR